MDVFAWGAPRRRAQRGAPKKNAPMSRKVKGTARARVESRIARYSTVVSGLRRAILRIRTCPQPAQPWREETQPVEEGARRREAGESEGIGGLRSVGGNRRESEESEVCLREAEGI